MPEQPQEEVIAVTPASAWQGQRQQGFLVPLPSGNVCRVKRVMDLKFMIKLGRIPNPLASFIQSMFDSGEVSLDLANMPDELKDQTIEMIDNTVAEMMVDPPCRIPPEKDEEGKPVAAELWQAPPGCISIVDLTAEDKLFLYQVAQGGTTDVERFREFQRGFVGALVDGKGVFRAPIGTPEPERSDSGSNGVG